MTFFKQTRPRRLFTSPRLSYLIFASPKSGTTWLQCLLSHHPATVCAESRPFGDYFNPGPASMPHLTLEKYCSILGGHFAPAVPGLQPEDGAFYQTLLFNLLDTVAATALAATGKSVYGEKFTPYRGTAGPALASLHEYHPRIRFVNLTRDGRDVIASGAAQWLNHRLRHARPEEREIFEDAMSSHTILPEDFELFLACWMEAVEAGLAARNLFGHCLQISYEALVADPVSQTAALFDFLGLKSNPATVRACVEATSFNKLSGGRKRGDEDLNSFFRKGEVGDWKNWFTSEQRHLFDEAAGHLLEELGYARETMPEFCPAGLP
jgi:hypothetical protein